MAAASFAVSVAGAAILGAGLCGPHGPIRAGSTTSTNWATQAATSDQQSTGTADGTCGGAASDDEIDCGNVMTMTHSEVDQSAARSVDEEALTALLASYDHAEDIDIAMTVIDHCTGLTYQYNGQERFETASIVKVAILAALELQAQRQGQSLTSTERTLAATMIENSDNDAASQLWSRIGAASGLAAAAPTLGLTATTPGGEGMWGTTTTTSDDQARMLRTIADPGGPLAGEAADYLFGLMRGVRADQAWGVSAAAGADERVMTKNGWFSESSLGDGWTINSIGRIVGAGTEVTIVVLTRGHQTMSSGVALIENIAKVARKYLAW